MNTDHRGSFHSLTYSTNTPPPDTLPPRYPTPGYLNPQDTLPRGYPTFQDTLPLDTLPLPLPKYPTPRYSISPDTQDMGPEVAYLLPQKGSGTR